MANKFFRWSLIGFAGVVVLVILAVATEDKNSKAVKAIVNIPQIMAKSPAQVDAILGTPAYVTPITSYPDQMPGEYRSYAIPELSECQVRYHNGVAVSVAAFFQDPAESAEKLLLKAGIDIEDAAPRGTGPLAKRWTGTFSGVYFSDLAAFGQSMKNPGNWVTVVAEGID